MVLLHLQHFPKILKFLGTLLCLGLACFSSLLWCNDFSECFNAWIALFAALERLWKLAGLLLLNVLEACWNRKLFYLSFPPLRLFWRLSPRLQNLPTANSFYLRRTFFFYYYWASDALSIFYPAIADGILITTSGFLPTYVFFKWFQVLNRNLWPCFLPPFRKVVRFRSLTWDPPNVRHR